MISFIDKKSTMFLGGRYRDDSLCGVTRPYVFVNDPYGFHRTSICRGGHRPPAQCVGQGERDRKATGEQSEWPRSTDEEGFSKPTKMSGAATGIVRSVDE